MDFAMATHVLLLTNTKGVFPTEGFRLGVYFLVFTKQCMRLAVFHVLLCSLKFSCGQRTERTGIWGTVAPSQGFWRQQ
jgi:hypothetical protein